MIRFRKIMKKGFNERFEVDSNGRRFDFVQQNQLNSWAAKLGQNKGTPHLNFQPASDDTSLVWVCSECGCRIPVIFDAFVHDEVTVPDPTEQLDQHDCDVEEVRKIMEQ